MAQLVESLPSMLEALDLGLSTHKLGVIVQAWNPSSAKVEAGGLFLDAC